MLENRTPHRSFMQHVLDILVVASNAESTRSSVPAVQIEVADKGIGSPA
jgi:hypothetical protein